MTRSVNVEGRIIVAFRIGVEGSTVYWSYLTARSSLRREPLWTPRISTNAETTWPSALVIVQPGPPGPGDTHPDGVFGPAVSQRLASPGLGAIIPGLKILPPSSAPPEEELVWPPRICSIVTTIGVHCTLGLQDPSLLNVGVGAIVSSAKFRLYGAVVPSNHMMPNVFLPVPSEAE